jgi:chromosome segregation ATPase
MLTIFQADEKHMKDGIQTASQDIQGLDMQLNQESQVLEEVLQNRKAAAKLEMDALRKKIRKLKEQRTLIETTLTNLCADLSKADAQRSDAFRKFEDKKKEEEDLQRKYQTCKSQIRDPLTQFGKDIRKVLDTIKLHQWKGAMPMGPLDMYVALKDPDYGEVLRQHVGRVLLSFVVTDAQDIRPLKEILRKHGK